MAEKTIRDAYALKIIPEAKVLLLALAERGGGEYPLREMAEACGVTLSTVDKAARYLARNGFTSRSKSLDHVCLAPDSEWIEAVGRSPRSQAAKELKSAKATILAMRAEIEDHRLEIERLRNIEGEREQLRQLLATADAERESYRLAYEKASLGG